MINISQVLTVDKQYLEERLGSLNAMRMGAVDAGLRLVLSL